jgi:hypothetical protein
MPTSNVALILAVTGCLALLAGLFGGGFKAEQVEIPKISGLPRVFSALIGLGLVGAATWLYVRPELPVAPQPTEVAKQVSPSSPEPPSISSATSQPPVPTDTPAPLLTAAAPQSAGLVDTATVLPSATAIVPTLKTPAGSLALYFSRLRSSGDCLEAWTQLTWNYQQKNYPKGSKDFGTNLCSKIDHVELNSAPTVINGTSAVCTVDATLHLKSGALDPIKATYHMVYTTDINGNQAWLIDEIDILP